MRKIVYVILLVSAFALGRLTAPVAGPQRVVETVFRVDTVRVVQPEVMVIHSREPVNERLPVAGSVDSAEVIVPMEQKVYVAQDYRAYVSGHHPRLDSIEIYKPVVRHKMQARVSLGVQAGYGFTPKGMQPYLGIGVSVRIL